MSDAPRLMRFFLTALVTLTTLPTPQAQPTEADTLGGVSVVLTSEASGRRLPQVPLRLLPLGREGGGWTGETDSEGAALFSGIPAGLYVLEAQPRGFAAEAEVVAVGEGERVVVRRRLLLLRELGEVRVEAERFSDRLVEEGFYDRRRRGFGYHVTRRQIEAQAAIRLSDILRRFPSVRILREGPLLYASNPTPSSLGLGFSASAADPGPTALSFACPYAIYTNGLAANFPDRPYDLDTTPLDIVAGVEVYPRSSTAPVLYREGTCGSILVWTR